MSVVAAACSDDSPSGPAPANPDSGVTDSAGPAVDSGAVGDASGDAVGDAPADADAGSGWARAEVCRPYPTRPGPAAPFVVSANGKYAAFVACGTVDAGKLFVRDLTAGVDHLISAAGNNYWTQIVFSPDQAYVAWSKGDGYADVHVRKVDASAPEIVVASSVAPATAKGAKLSWSPDSKYVVAVTTTPSLRYASADGTVAPTDIHAGAITTYAFTSNGARLVYQRTSDASWHSVGLLTNASTALTALTDLSAVSLVGGTANTVVGKRASDGFLVSVAASNGALTPISTAAVAGFFDWDATPAAFFHGGTHALYQNAARDKLFRRNYGGSDAEVTLADPSAANVFLSPDGARFLYAVGSEIRMVPANGSSAPAFDAGRCSRQARRPTSRPGPSEPRRSASRAPASSSGSATIPARASTMRSASRRRPAGPSRPSPPASAIS